MNVNVIIIVYYMFLIIPLIFLVCIYSNYYYTLFLDKIWYFSVHIFTVVYLLIMITDYLLKYIFTAEKEQTKPYLNYIQLPQINYKSLQSNK